MMLRILKLLLPAIIPSWRFFDVIAPSPRIQYALLTSENETPSEWLEFRPRPAHLSFSRMMGRMLWNPRWNESLFMVSCAERLLEQPTQHSEEEILKRISHELNTNLLSPNHSPATHLQFRLLLVQRQGQELKQHVAFNSRIQSLSAPGAE